MAVVLNVDGPLGAGSIGQKDPFIQNIHTRVMDTIQNSKNVPGLQAEEFPSLKAGIAERWNTLVDKGELLTVGTDKDVRPYFVALQGIVEHVLSSELNKSVKSLTGVIHTPAPATPLCTKGEVSKELVDQSIVDDPARLFTVKARTTILRDYLHKGGDLYVVYPKDGINIRKEDQKAIYQNELATNASHLFDRPLNFDSIHSDSIGAFYLFKNAEGKLFSFAIKMTQANNPLDAGSFGLWFGEYNASTPVYNRVTNIISNVLKHSQAPIPLPS